MDPLEAATIRLDHACAHLDSLKEEVRMYLDTQPYRVVAHDEPEEGRYVYRCEIGQPPTPRVGLLVGDVVHSIRAALDNLVWGFARLQHDPPKNPRLAFPIFKDFTGKRGWQATGQDAALRASLPRVVADAVRDIQPWKVSKSDPTQDPLWVLDRLWNDDKHRSFVTTGSAGGMSEIFMRHVSAQGFNGPWIQYGAFESGEIVGGFGYTPNTKAEVDAEAKFAFDIALPKEGPTFGAPAVPLLVGLHDYVRNTVLPVFAT